MTALAAQDRIRGRHRRSTLGRRILDHLVPARLLQRAASLWRRDPFPPLPEADEQWTRDLHEPATPRITVTADASQALQAIARTRRTLDRLAACWQPVPPASGPVPPAFADGDDPRYPHLGSGQYEHPTGWLTKITLEAADDR